MKKHLNTLAKFAARIACAGMLLQATGCEFDGTRLAEGLFVAVAQNLIQGFVFGAFNLV